MREKRIEKMVESFKTKEVLKKIEKRGK